MRRLSSLPTSRRPWIASAIWGWRLEVQFLLALLVALVVSSRFGEAGPFVVVGVTSFVLWQRPDWRARFSARAAANVELARLHNVFWSCGIVGRCGDIPRVIRSAPLPVGERYLVALPMGLHFEAIEARAPELAAALGVRRVRVRAIPKNARYVEIAVIRSTPFGPESAATRLHTAQAASLWDPTYLGTAEDGLPVRIGLAEHNLLIGGEPGSGKSVALSNLIAAAALDPEVQLTLLDGKHVELAAWRPVAHRFVGTDQDDAVAALAELHEELDARYTELLELRRRKIEPGDDYGLHVVVIDELAYFLRGGKRETRERFAELLRDLISRGRAAGIIVVAATQKPSHEVVPTWIRDLFSFRLAMRCTSTDASDTILGQGWASRGFSASSISPSDRGVGFLLAEGGEPVLVQTQFLGDDDIDVLVQRALTVRGLA